VRNRRTAIMNSIAANGFGALEKLAISPDVSYQPISLASLCSLSSGVCRSGALKATFFRLEGIARMLQVFAHAPREFRRRSA